MEEKYHNGVFEVWWEWINGVLHVKLVDQKTGIYQAYATERQVPIRNNKDAYIHIADLLEHKEYLDDNVDSFGWNGFNQTGVLNMCDRMEKSGYNPYGKNKKPSES